ncbi:hypothetical protein [Pantoea stewartii]|uniref:Nudix hydrolase n=1 Tax=Pantoea stewartii subsp. stewartii DC283 TaxID=660596 RepID=H3REV6_PANSE|nr:hypothetical protein [Pantoea stewartii]ARF50835.1 NUDIX hydrolase [Pantoea stewartii subsp. stewartii DC283]EHU00282.1 nudix hydrolase [Pantoea stewartii subsp. stewartii DC283]KAB0547457.1 NUDIX hydrolase [Pantoea stewartii subsp. stewartii]
MAVPKEDLKAKLLELIGSMAESHGVDNSEILNVLSEMQGADLKKADGNEPGRTAAIDEDEGSMTDAQVKADSAYVAIGKRAPAPFSGEKAMDYRKRALMGIQKLAKKFHDVNIRAVSDSATLSVLEDQIYQEATKSVDWALENTPGYLHQTVRMDEAGRRITEYQGDMRVWLNAFKTPPRRLVKINTGLH